MINLIQNLLIPVITIIGLIVLIALGKITSDVAVPVIIAIAGVHVGANISNPPPTPVKQPPPPRV